MEMSPFKWKNDFSVGIQELDDQHKDFFDIETDKKYGTYMLEVRE